MMEYLVDLRATRARKARLAHSIGETGELLLMFVTALSVIGALLLFVVGEKSLAFFALAVASICCMPTLWYKYHLKPLPQTSQNSFTELLSGEVLAVLDPRQKLTPLQLWKALGKHWQARFMANHFLLVDKDFEQSLSDIEADLPTVWQASHTIATGAQSKLIEPGHLVAALMLTSPTMRDMLVRTKHNHEDVVAVSRWLDRGLQQMRREKPFFGGIGRDWANGFTPLLNNFGHNLSLSIERSGGSHESLTNATGTEAMKKALEQGASAIALIGDSGIGKTSYVYALAQALLKDSASTNSHISHKQIVELDSNVILSNARGPGELERIMVSLVNETAHAGNIILFLDNASLFIKSGPGAFDATQILLPIVQSHAIQLILAITPHDYQRLRSENAAFASALTPVVLQEPDQAATMRILEDNALHLEARHKVLIAHEALKETYVLSGRYDQDGAYPGKAIRLLQQSIPYANQSVITANSIQQAIEKMHGVKVQTAAAAETDTLLHLEDKIHERMINQTHAVKVVASALRRARAGVSNPKRPIGSFLFLGPTGVGKTELAKAIAAVYFGAESNMVRLDMSEYQQESDVERLLSNGADASKSLIMSVRNQPFSVVLLDEIEKAHPNILNLLLQLLDEGQLTDANGRPVSFKDCIIIATSNAGANSIREHIAKGEALESFATQLTDVLINSGQYKPELLNRFDEIVLFRPLNADELAQVVKLMLNEVNRTLAAQNITVQLTDAAVAKIVEVGNDPRLGARPIRRALQRAVEDGIAGRILRGEVKPGDHVTLDVGDLS